MKLHDVRSGDERLDDLVLVMQTAREMQRLGDACLERRAGLSLIKMAALQTIASNGGEVTATQLAEWTQTERHNITTLMERLLKDRLITRERDIRDKRKVNVCLTILGRRKLEEARKVLNYLVDEVGLRLRIHADQLSFKGLRDYAHELLLQKQEW